MNDSAATKPYAFSALQCVKVPDNILQNKIYTIQFAKQKISAVQKEKLRKESDDFLKNLGYPDDTIAEKNRKEPPFFGFFGKTEFSAPWLFEENREKIIIRPEQYYGAIFHNCKNLLITSGNYGYGSRLVLFYYDDKQKICVDAYYPVAEIEACHFVTAVFKPLWAEIKRFFNIADASRQNTRLAIYCGDMEKSSPKYSGEALHARLQQELGSIITIAPFSRDLNAVSKNQILELNVNTHAVTIRHTGYHNHDNHDKSANSAATSINKFGFHQQEQDKKRRAAAMPESKQPPSKRLKMQTLS